jgi:hypothetical protein
MKLEGDYAVDKSQRAHRIASAVVLCVWIGLAFHYRGLGQALRTAAAFVLPMGCIWIPDVLGSFTGLPGGPQIVDERSHPIFLRWAGWLVLLVVPLVLIGMRSR